MKPKAERNIRYEITPAAERLDKLDEKDQKLERDFAAKLIGVDEYASAKHALLIKRNKEWATLCRAMGWPIEYNPLTVDIDIPPAPVEEETEPVAECPEVRKRRHKHYKVFAGWVVVLVVLYLWLGG